MDVSTLPSAQKNFQPNVPGGRLRPPGFAGVAARHPAASQHEKRIAHPQPKHRAWRYSQTTTVSRCAAKARGRLPPFLPEPRCKAPNDVETVGRHITRGGDADAPRPA